jgi:hypothetical protein
MRKTFLVALALTGFGLGSASVGVRADDVTTTTTTRTTDEPNGVTVGVPGVVGVQIGGGTRPEGCTSRKTTSTNEDTGTTVSRKTTDCD